MRPIASPRKPRGVLAAAALTLLLGAAACDSHVDPPAALQLLTGADSAGSALVLAPATLDLRVGGSAQLVLTGPSTLLPASYSTSAPRVASVTSTGLVTGFAEGTAVITAASTTDPTRRASAVVRVVGP